MSRIEQWIAFVISIITLGTAVLGGTYWYVSKEAPALIKAELDARDVAATENRPDEIVEALTSLATQVNGLASAQTEMKAEINANFEFLIEKIMEL